MFCSGCHVIGGTFTNEIAGGGQDRVRGGGKAFEVKNR